MPNKLSYLTGLPDQPAFARAWRRQSFRCYNCDCFLGPLLIN